MGSRPSSHVLTQPGAYRLYSVAEVLRQPPPQWLIAPVLPAGGLVGLIGQPGAGKTFLALDWALSVATGGLWQGIPVRRGHVVYISAEGGGGIGKRLHAWLTERGVEAKDPWLSLMLEAIPIQPASEGVDGLLARIDEIEAQPDLLVIDTLARCFAGNENQQEDMGQFIAGVDRLRTHLSCTVVIVHHMRLDGERERGNTAFRGAADTMLFLTRENKTNPIYLQCVKQKDAEEFNTYTLKLKYVPEAESLVVSAGHANNAKHGIARMLKVLHEHGPLTAEDWSQRCAVSGLPRSTFYRALRDLCKTHQIVRKKGQYAVRV